MVTEGLRTFAAYAGSPATSMKSNLSLYGDYVSLWNYSNFSPLN